MDIGTHATQSLPLPIEPRSGPRSPGRRSIIPVMAWLLCASVDGGYDCAVDPLIEAIRKYWGFDALRPLQREAMDAALQGRDSLVVLPTGGGKSLCYQAPAVISDRLTVVISPLIALMKDQVDRLLGRGIPAAFLNSTLDADDRRRVIAGITKREYRLVFAAPERLASGDFYRLLADANVGSFAIDEAHCISHWGHDFRSDYRRLGELKERFPRTPVHAFTATATPRVRADVVAQLGLTDPQVLVGDFFRPNLHYRVLRRGSGLKDITDAVTERKGKIGIVYCIRRADVDELTMMLRGRGVRAVGYHAGMSDVERTRVQDAFAIGEEDVVVATVAFGMGIDRADIRFVIHAAMPKSVEHYQQETGRAGRDGEPAECVLYYSGSDFHTWQRIIEKNETSDLDDKVRMLSEMYRFCTSGTCRHRRLVGYFGQQWQRSACGACDLCCGELSPRSDSTVLAQKIMSCVARTGERYGATHVINVLQGILTEQVTQRGHEKLSTFGLTPEHERPALMAWIDQLVDADLLAREGEYRVLKVTSAGWHVLRSQQDAMLFDPPASTRKARRPAKRSALSGSGAGVSAAPMDRLDAAGRALLEQLRLLRRQIAEEEDRPAFMVFNDRALRQMASTRPQTRAEFLAIKGVGPAKFEQYGEQFLQAIRSAAGAEDAA